MNDLGQDLRYGARMLAKNPGFTLIAIVTLALGIGANTTIFSVINSLLLKPFPFADPDRLGLVFEIQSNDPNSWSIVSAPNYLDWQRQNDVFASMALFDSAGKGYDLSGGAEPERVSGVRVSTSFFDVLGEGIAVKRLSFEGAENHHLQRAGKKASLFRCLHEDKFFPCSE